ncbi:MAG: hypothetical protein ACO31J_11035, partial [Burkholderiaceae bacterium]
YSELGAMIGAYMLMGTFAALPLGMLARRIGDRIVLGGGLARDSEIAMRGQRDEGSAWVAFDERSATAFRRYFELLPRGRHVVEYTLRLNQSAIR